MKLEGEYRAWNAKGKTLSSSSEGKTNSRERKVRNGKGFWPVKKECGEEREHRRHALRQLNGENGGGPKR